MSSRKYRPWISTERQSHITDKALLNRVKDQSKTPFGIAKGHERVSTVRVQCHYLTQLGYLNRISADTYRLTAAGDDVRQDSTQFNDGYISLVKRMRPNYQHVTDIGAVLGADTIIEVNKRFLSSDETEYEGSVDQLQQIENTQNKRLNRLTAEFPRFEPLANQLAHTVRTFCGYHLFPDANHRTGTEIALTLAKQAGYNLFPLIQEDSDGIRRAVQTSKILRGMCSNIRNSVDFLWMKDELFYHWSRYFRDLMYDLAPQKRVHMETGRCQYSNLVENERVGLLYEFSIKELDNAREALRNE